MTTEWLSGLLVIASVLMCLWLLPLVREEARSHEVPWWRNKALRLSSGLLIHAIGAIALFFTFRAIGVRIETLWPSGVLWTLWFGLGCWLVAKTVMLSTSTWFRMCLALYAVWTAAYFLRGYL